MEIDILSESKAKSAQIISWRRHLHKYPEVGFQEEETAKFIAKQLESFGLSVKTQIGKTGIVASLGSGRPCIALRADMDALPIQDSKTVDYASKNVGVSHACGHDAHVAMLLGVAAILSKIEDHLPGEIRFLFQPFEEGQDPSGLGGATAMLQEGNVLDGVDVIIGQHVHGELEAGTFQVKKGYFSAAVDTFKGKIIGKGCHGAYPHNGIDPILLAAQVISLVQGIVSRRIDPLEAAVISFGQIHAGTAPNIIPEEVFLEGTIRSLNPEIRLQLHSELEKAFKSVETFGGKYEFELIRGSPSIDNDSTLVDLLQQVATEFLPEKKILEGGLGMGAEDFADFLQYIPGAFYYLGAALKPFTTHHSPDFDIDDSVLYIGTAIMAEAAVRFLSRS
ncbi:MAG: M20 metallopeptidase family protein [Candidatus Hodarchaeales archaeon]|jgi:amidohydrolase